ncbi:MAG: AAA family ATPase [Pseudomonadota bacterium]
MLVRKVGTLKLWISFMPKYAFDQRPNTVIEYENEAIAEQIKTGPYSCIIGPNNTGKSFLLKSLVLDLGETANYLGPARYNNFNSLSPYAPNPSRRSKWWRAFRQQFKTENQNIDNSPFNIQQAIAELSDERRNRLFEIVKELLGVELSLELSHPQNEMSQRYISSDGHNFSYSSSGTRLVVSIITSLLDEEFTHFLIDEPELGVSPKAQGQLADFLLDGKNRAKYFPHATNIVFATHSSLFLDRKNISNNFIIQKSEDTVRVTKLETLADFNQVHFFLLGNRLESLFLPSVILFVEGPTEEKYLNRVLQTKYPELSASIINATNDTEMKRYAHMMSQIFPDIQRSPYNGRIVPILDSVHGRGITDALRKKGVSEDRIITWSKNGIEHFYPESIMREIFGGYGPMSILGDDVTMCGITIRKMDLVDLVVSKINDATEYPDEFSRKLFTILDAL